MVAMLQTSPGEFVCSSFVFPHFRFSDFLSARERALSRFYENVIDLIISQALGFL